MPKRLLASLEGLFSPRITLREKPRPEPEPAFERKARAGTGLFALLTEEQKAHALAGGCDSPVRSQECA